MAQEKPTECKQSGRFHAFYRGITVEPIALFVQFAIVSQVTIINEYITWAYDEQYITGTQDGANASKLEMGEVEAATESADFIATNSLMATLPPLFTVYFYGAYSDKVGRKAVMFFPLTGLFIALLINMIIIKLGLTTNLILLSTFIIYGSGGIQTLDALEYAYISDITPPTDYRTTRFLYVKAAEILALTIGQLVGGELITNCGYFYAMLVMWLSSFCGLAYTALFLPNQMPVSQEVSHWKTCSLLRKLPRMLGARSEVHYRRMKLFVYSYILFIQAFYFSGGLIAMTLFLINPPINMSADLLAYFLVVYLFTRLVGTVILILIQKSDKIQLNDYQLLGVSLVSALLGTIGLSVPFYNYIYIFLVPIVGCASSVPDIICRSAMSKLVSPSDQGAISAWATLVCSIAGLIGASLMPAIYSLTFTIYVPAAFCVASVTYISGLVLLTVLYMVAGGSELVNEETAKEHQLLNSNSNTGYGSKP